MNVQAIINHISFPKTIDELKYDTVSAVIITALMQQTPHPAVLTAVHDGDSGRAVLLHAMTSFDEFNVKFSCIVLFSSCK